MQTLVNLLNTEAQYKVEKVTNIQVKLTSMDNIHRKKGAKLLIHNSALQRDRYKDSLILSPALLPIAGTNTRTSCVELMHVLASSC